MGKQLIILRGLPGSGKTHGLHDTDKAIICSADHFFVTDQGNYMFDPSKLAEAHMACQLKALSAMTSGAPLVIIDNTNSRYWEFEIYKRMGGIFGYSVDVRTIGGRSYENVREYAQRNIHDVPEDIILKMAYRWED